jgi:uncharacterized protein YceK
MKRLMTICLLSALVVGMSGCATSIARCDRASHPVYPATRLDGYFFGASLTDGETFSGYMKWWERPIFLTGSVIDLPFSLVLDTLMLPLDIMQLDDN